MSVELSFTPYSNEDPTDKGEVLNPLPNSFFLDTQGLDKYINHIKDPIFKIKMLEFVAANETSNPSLQVGNFAKFLQDTAIASGVRYKYTKKPKLQNPWFDNECQEDKNHIMALTKDIASGDKQAIQQLKWKKKLFRAKTRSKKNKYFHEQAQYLANETKCPTKFWRKTSNLRNATRGNCDFPFLPKPVIKYFKDLLSTNRSQSFDPSPSNDLPSWNKPHW